MASIYKVFLVNAPPQFVWEAIRDIGAVHARLARGFVTDTTLGGDMRTVTFANGFVVQEQAVSVDDEIRRFVYRSVDGRASHHNAFFQIFHPPEGRSNVLWITDRLPDEMREPIEQMVASESDAIQRTLEESYRASE